jgi:hypothetical protein
MKDYLRIYEKYIKKNNLIGGNGNADIISNYVGILGTYLGGHIQDTDYRKLYFGKKTTSIFSLNEEQLKKLDVIDKLNDIGKDVNYSVISHKKEFAIVQKNNHMDQLIFLFPVGKCAFYTVSSFRSKIMSILDMIIGVNELLINKDILTIHLIGHSYGMVIATLFSYLLLCIDDDEFCKMNSIIDCVISEYRDNPDFLQIFDNLKKNKVFYKLHVCGGGGFSLPFENGDIFNYYYEKIQQRYIHFVIIVNNQLDSLIFCNENNRKSTDVDCQEMDESEEPVKSSNFKLTSINVNIKNIAESTTDIKTPVEIDLELGIKYGKPHRKTSFIPGYTPIPQLHNYDFYRLIISLIYSEKIMPHIIAQQ